MNSTELRLQIIDAGYKSVKELIKVAKQDIIKIDPEDELSADKLKNAAVAKKLCIFDAFEILKRIDEEKEIIAMEANGPGRTDTKQGFAERRSQ
jgi:hypothetical protein